MTVSHAEKMARFRALHRDDGILLMPNAWDRGSAVIMDKIGYQALATTSAGVAFSRGVRDSCGDLSRDDVLTNAREIVAVTELPVSADLENGFGTDPEDCATTVRAAFAVGLCGGAIEDADPDPANPIYAFELAVERIQAAVDAKPSPDFMITARSENFLYGRPDLRDTIRRLQAFEEVGADVLYAPGLPNLDAVRAVCSEVSKPVNVVLGLTGDPFTVQELERIGVRRISTGGSIARAALGAAIRAGVELIQNGTTEYAASAIPDAEAQRYMVGSETGVVEERPLWVG